MQIQKWGFGIRGIMPVLHNNAVVAVIKETTYISTR